MHGFSGLAFRVSSVSEVTVFDWSQHGRHTDTREVSFVRVQGGLTFRGSTGFCCGDPPGWHTPGTAHPTSFFPTITLVTEDVSTPADFRRLLTQVLRSVSLWERNIQSAHLDAGGVEHLRGSTPHVLVGGLRYGDTMSLTARARFTELFEGCEFGVRATVFSLDPNSPNTVLFDQTNKWRGYAKFCFPVRSTAVEINLHVFPSTACPANVLLPLLRSWGARLGVLPGTVLDFLVAPLATATWRTSSPLSLVQV